MEFGEKLVQLRTEQKLTQTNVADAIGISRRAYASYENSNIRPRNDQTYIDLAKVLKCDANYLRVEDSPTKGKVDINGVAEGVGLATAAMALPGVAPIMLVAYGIGKIFGNSLFSKPSDKEEGEEQEQLSYSNDKLLQYERLQKQFANLAVGMLNRAALEKNIECHLARVDRSDDRVVPPDACFTITGHESIRKWWLIFWSEDKDLDEYHYISTIDRAGVLLSRFTRAEPDPSRMASIVVDDPELFKAIVRFKNKNCYRGNLSVILVDTVSILDEEIISTHNREETISWSLV